jgi:hypothetical protein
MEEPGAGGEALPTFLVIGAQKSATTSLIHYLGAHPEVFALPDEVHFFDRNFDRGVGWYRGMFAGAAGARAVGESTPEYMYFDDVPERMARVLPAARLVAILRDPVERAYSHYWHNRTRGHEPLRFQQALEAEAHRLAGADREARSRYSYLDRGRYLVQLRRVCDHFPRQALHVLLVDDLRSDRTAAVQRVYRFLGVADRFVPPEIGRERNRFVRYRSQRLRRPIRRLPGPLRRVAARLNVRYEEYPALPSDARVELRKRFAEDNAALASWLGRDLSAWDG